MTLFMSESPHLNLCKGAHATIKKQDDGKITDAASVMIKKYFNNKNHEFIDNQR